MKFFFSVSRPITATTDRIRRRADRPCTRTYPPVWRRSSRFCLHRVWWTPAGFPRQSGIWIPNRQRPSCPGRGVPPRAPPVWSGRRTKPPRKTLRPRARWPSRENSFRRNTYEYTLRKHIRIIRGDRRAGVPVWFRVRFFFFLFFLGFVFFTTLKFSGWTALATRKIPCAPDGVPGERIY